MKKVFRHIGYFNNYQDCKLLFEETANYAVAYMKAGMGEFHTVDGDEETDIENVADESDCAMFKQTSVGEDYLVRYEKGSEDGDGWYIDIYKLIELTANDTDTITEMVQEYCGHCQEYVMLQAELKVQKCPNCGMMIVPCSMCPMLDDENSHLRNCKACPLGKLCDEQNKGLYVTLMELAYKFNQLTLKEKENGLNVTMPSLSEGDCTESIFIHYNTTYECVVFLDIAQYGKAYAIKANKLDRIDVQKALQAMFGRTTERVYVKQHK
jgi:predicted RNA-binding Zn-ribbon protein involved in translation (DUF1610 family)